MNASRAHVLLLQRPGNAKRHVALASRGRTLATGGRSVLLPTSRLILVIGMLAFMDDAQAIGLLDEGLLVIVGQEPVRNQPKRNLNYAGRNVTFVHIIRASSISSKLRSKVDSFPRRMKPPNIVVIIRPTLQSNSRARPWICRRLDVIHVSRARVARIHKRTTVSPRAVRGRASLATRHQKRLGTRAFPSASDIYSKSRNGGSG